ncbi:MAG TPA: hypothetical protein VKP66_00765 [Steroidobacteraceae bacterium]|nr:hypothetical protein [Steroidobacteraceae bacterium]
MREGYARLRYSEYQAVGEIHGGALSKVLERFGHHVGVLHGKLAVIQQHFHRDGQFLA